MAKTKKSIEKSSTTSAATTPSAAGVKAPAGGASRYTVGEFVHFHQEADESPGQRSALAALVLHVADSETGRADLLVFNRDGTTSVERDVLASTRRAPNHWSERSTA